MFKLKDYEYWKKEMNGKRGSCAKCKGRLKDLGECSFAPKGESFIRLCPDCFGEVIDWHKIGSEMLKRKDKG